MAKKTDNQEKNHLKIIGLKVNGFRKLTAVEMQFAECGLTQIRGRNRNGKTSVLDTVEWLIKGNKTLNKDVIQHGRDKATAELMLGKYVITRVVTQKTTRLEVRNTETDTVLTGEVQNFLYTLINEITFNSRSFLDKTPLEQLRFCMDLFRIDFTEIDKKLQTLEQDRLICGREVDKFGDLDESKPEKVERVDITSLISKRKEIEAKNAEIDRNYQQIKDAGIAKIEAFNKEQRRKTRDIELEEERLADLRGDEKYIENEIKQLELKLKELKAELKVVGNNIIDSLQKLKELPHAQPEKPLTVQIVTPPKQSTDDIDAKIQNATAINQKADLYDQWIAKKKEKAEKDAEYKAYDTKIDALRKKKIEILTGIDTGVEGFEIREDGLYYKGIYSENWSDMESIRIASELCMAQDPSLRAIFIDRFESFDKESREDFNKWAISKGIQVIVTKVEDEIPVSVDEPNVFYIEDGSIVVSSNGNGKATKKQVEELA